MELRAHTAAGADLVALAERLAEDLGSRAAAHDRDGTYPHDSIRALRDAGYLVAPVPVRPRRAGRAAPSTTSSSPRAAWPGATPRSRSASTCISSP